MVPKKWLVGWALAAAAALTARGLYAQQMVFPGQVWQPAAPESVLVDSQKLQAAVETLRRNVDSVDELVVIKNGRLIWAGEKSQAALRTWSVTKSFATTMLGWAIDRNLIDLDALAKDYVPAMADKYPDVTVRHLVTHTNGYLAEGEVYPFVVFPPDPFVPADPLFTPPGSMFAYNDSGVDQMMNILSLVTGDSIADLFQTHIGDVIGIESNTWEWGAYETSDGRLVQDGGGAPDGSVIISADGLARLGHLFLNHGSWDGQQLISKAWVDEATRVQVPESMPTHPKASPDGPGEYGYGWWVKPDFFAALGYQLNWLLVSPGTDYVVGRLGTETQWTSHEVFLNKLYDAITPAVWDEQGDGSWDEVNPATGAPRWQTESGLVPEIYPTGSAVIRSNRVSVSDGLRVHDLSIESGSVKVDEGIEFMSSGTTEVQGDGTLHVDGAMHVHDLIVREGSVQAAPSSALGIDNLRIRDRGATHISGELSVNYARIDDGRLSLHAAAKPFHVEKSFIMSAGAELEFQLKGEAWNSPLTMADTLRPRPGGTLFLSFALEANPSVSEGQVFNLFDWAVGSEPTTTFANIVYPSRTIWDLSQLYTTGEVVLVSVLNQPIVAGDFNGDEQLDATDIDELVARIRVSSSDAYYDVDANSLVDHGDLVSWVHDLKNTYFGDANLDGEFNSTDLVDVLVAGTYELDIDATWESGDFDGSGRFDSGDLIYALSDGGYEQGPRPPAPAVPEPSSLLVLLVGIGTLGFVGGELRRNRVFSRFASR